VDAGRLGLRGTMAADDPNPEWCYSNRFYSLVEDLNDAQLSVRHKVSLVEAFCSKKNVEQSAFVDYVLEDQSCKLSIELLRGLLATPQTSPPAAARAGAPPPAPAAGVSRVADDVARMPSAARERMDLAARQRELLQPYGKQEAKQELEQLRDAPNPVHAPGAAEILFHGGAPADELRAKIKRWEQAQKAAPAAKKESAAGGGSRAPPPARLQLHAWVIGTNEDEDNRLEISSLGVASPKLRDDDAVLEALERTLKNAASLGGAPLVRICEWLAPLVEGASIVGIVGVIVAVVVRPVGQRRRRQSCSIHAVQAPSSSVRAADRQRAGRARGPEAHPKRHKSEMDESMQVGRARHACSCVRSP
jgi:hypothetical protein